MTWLLITVTGDGQVNTSRHRTYAEAEAAAYLARYGMTKDELEQLAVQRQQSRQIQIDRYKEAHPPRPPTKEEREVIKQSVDNNGVFLGFGMTSNGFETFTKELTADGLIQELRYPNGAISASYSHKDGEWCDWVAGAAVIRNRSSVKEFRIIQEADDDKEPAP